MEPRVAPIQVRPFGDGFLSSKSQRDRTMKKKELVHLHGLLGAVAGDLMEEGVVSESDLAEYERIGTSPMAMRGSRADHRAAALALAESLADSVDAEPGATETAPDIEAETDASDATDTDAEADASDASDTDASDTDASHPLTA